MLHDRHAVPGVELVEELGRGAGSVVYLARRASREYAVKVLRALRQADDGVAFRREAARLAALDHPALVRIHEVGLTGDLPYIVMDMVHGRPLSVALADGPVAENTALDLAEQLAGALGAAHRAGLVHRDVKPDNVLIRSDGRVHLIDFGLAARAGNAADGTAVGTFDYSAPEQTGMLRRAVDGRADLYSLGVVLYECLTGRRPFVAADTGELLRLHLIAPAPGVRAVRPSVSPAAAAVVARLLAKDPDDRYSSAGGLQADLLRILGGQHAEFPLGTEETADDGKLAGHSEQLRWLLDAWQAALAGRGRAVLLVGPPGAGKSRLARELAAAARAAGRIALHGSGGGAAAPFAPLREAVDAHLCALETLPEAQRAAGRASVRSAVGDTAALLAPLSERLAEDRVGLAAPGDPDQVATAVSEFMLELASATPGVPGALLHLDNIDACDEATRLVLLRLVASLPRAPLLVVLTARDSATAGVADDVIEVGPLDHHGIAQLVRGMLGTLSGPADLVARLAVRSAGNPLAAIEYIRAVIDAGLLRPSWGRWLLDEAGLDALALPADVMDLVLRRVDALGPEARRLLTIAAALGSRFTSTQVARVDGADAVDAKLADAVDARLVEPAGTGGYAFVHDRIREALLDDLDEAAQRGLHQRVAEALDAADAVTPEDVYALAEHYLRGETGHAPQRAFRAAAAAGSLALGQQAAADALGLLRRAAAVADAADLATDAAFHADIADAALNCGHVGLARDHAIVALGCEDDPLRRASLHNLLASAYQVSWNSDEALEQMRRGLAQLGRPLTRRPVLAALSAVSEFARGLALGAVPPSMRRSRDRDRDRDRVHAQLLFAGAHSASLAMRMPEIAMITLRGLPVAARLGPGPEYSGIYGGLAAMAVVAHLPTLSAWTINRATAAVAGSGDLGAIAQAAWMRALVEDAMQPMGPRSGAPTARMLSEHGRWLEVGQYLTGVCWVAYFQLARGYQQDAEDWHGRALARTAGRHEAQGNVVAGIGVQAAALAGQPAEAAKLLAEMQVAVSGRPEAVATRIDLALTGLQVALEQGENGAAFDQAVARFEAFGLAAHEVWQPQRIAWVHRAYGRLAQVAAAPPRERQARLEQAARAVAQLGAAANGPLLHAYHLAARASLLHLRGDHRGALRDLAALDVRGAGVDVPLVDYEAARLRARIAAALGHAGNMRRHARAAWLIAADLGWQLRARWVAAEFGLDVPVAAGRGPVRLTHRSTPESGEAGEHVYRRRLVALQQVSLAAVTVLDPAQLSRVALDEIVRIFAAERAFLFLQEDGALLPYVGRNDGEHDVAEPTGYGSTLVRRVFDTGQAVVVTGSEEGEALGSRSTVVHGLRSIMVAPLALQGRMLGVVYLDSRVAKGIFTGEDVNILTAITNHVAMALETARAAQLERAVHAAQRQRDLAETLRQAMAELAGTLDPALVAQRLLKALDGLVPVGAALLLHRADGAPLTAAATSGVRLDPGQVAAAIATGLNDPRTEALLAAREPTHGQPPEQPVPLPEFLGADAVGWLAVPLHLRGESRGLLLASAPRRPFTAAEVGIAAVLAEQGLVALDNAVLFQRVQYLAARDGLTGLFNRRHFADLAGDHLAAGTPTAAVMVDIDLFKRINDTHGHGVGDQVIRIVAQRLAASLRVQDVICRYGGEEFAVLLPDATEDQARAVAARLLAAVTAEPVPTDAGPLDVTVSLGLAMPSARASLGALMDCADGALYEAKRSGRNRVIAAA